jgi:zinc/manganese transport system substrate-binding protein
MLKARLAACGAALFVLVFHTPLACAMPVKVVATLPVLREFVEQVGREHVEARSLITGFESEHSYSPKPSDLRAIGEARLLIEIGLGLEVWVAGLVKNAGNSALQVITTSRDVPLIADSDPGHPSKGNPHIWLDPENAKIMLRHIAWGLIGVDPSHRIEYQANLDQYLKSLDQALRQLQLQASTVQDRRIVTYHPAWPYFARRFGFRVEDIIIGQIGAEPTTAHLARLARRIKNEKIKVIVSEPQLNQKLALALAQESGARVVVLSPLPGAIAGTGTYLDMLAYDIAKLTEALRS